MGAGFSLRGRLHPPFAHFSNTALSEQYPCQLGKANKAKKAERDRLGVDMRLEKGFQPNMYTAARRWSEQVMSSHALAPQAERQQSSPLNSAEAKL